jgi:hypothetical protein
MRGLSSPTIVMAGLDPAIHVPPTGRRREDVDAGATPEYDEKAGI